MGKKGNVKCAGCGQQVQWTQAQVINGKRYCHMCIKSDAPLDTAVLAGSAVQQMGYRICPVCEVRKLRFIEVCDSEKDEEKTSWTCDCCNALVYIYIRKES